MNHSAKRRSAVRKCVFFCVSFFCRRVSVVFRSCRTVKMTDEKEQRICPTNFVSNSARQLRKHTECLKKHLLIMRYT